VLIITTAGPTAREGKTTTRVQSLLNKNRGQRQVQKSVSVSSPKYLEHCPHDNLNIQHYAPIINVPNIKVDALVHRLDIRRFKARSPILKSLLSGRAG
jgi:hypothetical protein